MPLAEITQKCNGEAFTAIFWRNSYSSKHGISNGHLNGWVVRISLVVQWLGTHRAVLGRGVWFLLRALRPHVLQWLSLHPTNSTESMRPSEKSTWPSRDLRAQVRLDVAKWVKKKKKKPKQADYQWLMYSIGGLQVKIPSDWVAYIHHTAFL